MTEFRQLSDRVWASPQICEADLDIAADENFALIINNRPDDEAPDQPDGATIEAAAQQAGLDYRAIPVGHGGFSQPQVEAMAAALEETNGKVLAYCRSGTRSTFLWALARASRGEEPDDITAAASRAGYDVSPIRPALEALAAGN